ncbi:MAG: FtsH protease activity modulator HflK, partial [Gammaproteobacteria bacterium]
SLILSFYNSSLRASDYSTQIVPLNTVFPFKVLFFISFTMAKNFSISVQYRISNLKNFILNVKSPEESLRQAAESALRHVVGDNSLDQALTVGRESIGDQVKERIQSYLDLYEAGIVVEIVNVQGTNPPSAVKDAFDDFIAAREDKERYQNEAQRYAFTIVPEARGQAQARIQEAEGYKLEVVANAQGEVDRFNQLLFEYQKAPEVTRDRLYLDALQSVLSSSTKVMIDVEGGNNLLYLPWFISICLISK